MNIVINKDNEQRYTINNYNLKVLQCSLPDLAPVPAGIHSMTFKELSNTQNVSEEHNNVSQEHSGEAETLESEQVQVDQSELIDSLLKKADDFSSKYLKVQMEYEELQEKTASNEEKIRQEAYTQGYERAKAEALETEQNQEKGLQTQLKDTMQRLEEEITTFQSALKRVEEELVSAALEISKEVILKELEENSSQIAEALAHNIIESIEKDSAVKIKVNAKQLTLFKEVFSKDKNITIEEDSAVVDGGIIVISQSGTIEADIMQRYENAKKSVLRH